MGEGQPDMKRDETGLRSGAEQNEAEHQSQNGGCMLGVADRVEAVGAGGPGKQPEGQQQGQGAEARHHQVDVAGADIFAIPMVGHDQGPGGERHELPGQQEGERVGRQHDQVHPCQERRKKRQHPLRRRLVASIAQPVESRRRPAQVDDDEKESRECVHAEMCPQPRQPQRQNQHRRLASFGDEMNEGRQESDGGCGETRPVDHPIGSRIPADDDGKPRATEQKRDTPQHYANRHRVPSFMPPEAASWFRRPGVAQHPRPTSAAGLPVRRPR